MRCPDRSLDPEVVVGAVPYARGMAAVHELSRTDARRLAVRAQRLTADRAAGVVETVQQLSVLQLDPTRAIAPSAELVLWSRLGSSFSTAELWDAVDELRLIQFRGTLRPAEDIALFRAEMELWRDGELTGWREAHRQWVRDNDAFRLDLLERLRGDGPLHLRDLPDTAVRPWKSTGWNNNRNVQMMLDQLVKSGEVAVAGGIGRSRLWDLASRVYPDEDTVIPLEESLRLRDERRLGALGLARPAAPETPFERLGVAEAGEPAVVEGVPGEWRVDPALLDGPFAGRTALLSPFDRLLYDRLRMNDVFEFDYVLEMYKPEAKRRWGYYALPILYADRLVGKLDARADRKAGILEVFAVHEDVPFTRTMRTDVHHEIEDLARWLDLEPVRGD